MNNTSIFAKLSAAATILTLALPGTAFAGDATVAASKDKPQVVDASKPVVLVDSTNPTKPPVLVNTTSWGGLGWGIGLAANFDVTGRRVVNASLVNNIVRIDDATSNVNVGFVLEAHYFIRDWTFSNQWRDAACTLLVGDVFCMDIATGPFVAIQVGGGNSAIPGDKDLVTAYALGWMVGLRHPRMLTSANANQSWNFGIGLRIDPNAKLLGDGIVPNQALPIGETTIRYKNEARYGLMLLSSFSF